MQDNRTPPVDARPENSPIPDFALTGLSVADLNAIMDGLSGLPFRVANPVVQKIQNQITQYNLALVEGAKAKQAKAEAEAASAETVQ